MGPSELDVLLQARVIQHLVQGEELVPVAEGVCQRVQVPDDTGRKFDQERHQLVSDPHAQKTTTFVGWVRCKRNTVTLEVREDVGAAGSQQGPDAIAIASGQHAEPTRPCATEQSKQNGLGASGR